MTDSAHATDASAAGPPGPHPGSP
ncbi:MAG: hypothetical protein JWP48_134, partial [Actinoallomurus sp.]|nr:hypothetical protein [Actinoallomurus sp.]